MPTINGTDSFDQLVGTGGNEIIYAYLGNDILFGNGGLDQLYGGGGRDYIHLNAPDISASAGSLFDGGEDYDRLSINDITGGIDLRQYTIRNFEEINLRENGSLSSGIADAPVTMNAAQISANGNSILKN